jgi:hypothetical protein
VINNNILRLYSIIKKLRTVRLSIEIGRREAKESGNEKGKIVTPAEIQTWNQVNTIALMSCFKISGHYHRDKFLP